MSVITISVHFHGLRECSTWLPGIRVVQPSLGPRVWDQCVLPCSPMVRLSRVTKWAKLSQAPGSGGMNGMNRCILVMFQYVYVFWGEKNYGYVWEFVGRNCAFVAFRMCTPLHSGISSWNCVPLGMDWFVNEFGIQLYRSMRRWGYQLYQVINPTRVLWTVWTLGELHSL